MKNGVLLKSYFSQTFWWKYFSVITFDLKSFSVFFLKDLPKLRIKLSATNEYSQILTDSQQYGGHQRENGGGRQ